MRVSLDHTSTPCFDSYPSISENSDKRSTASRTRHAQAILKSLVEPIYISRLCPNNVGKNGECKRLIGKERKKGRNSYDLGGVGDGGGGDGLRGKGG